MPDVLNQLLGWVQVFSYFGPILLYAGAFLLMALSGHAIPIPQDISLISMGYLSALGYLNIVPVVILAIMAPVASDAFLYFLSHHGSRFAPDPEKYQDMKLIRFAKHHMHNNTILVVMLMRLVTGFRFMSPVVGAYIKVPFKKYIFANFISALVFGPLFVLLGYLLHDQITFIIDTLKSLEHVGLVIFALAVLSIVGIFAKNRYNIRNVQE